MEKTWRTHACWTQYEEKRAELLSWAWLSIPPPKERALFPSKSIFSTMFSLDKISKGLNKGKQIVLVVSQKFVQQSETDIDWLKEFLPSLYFSNATRKNHHLRTDGQTWSKVELPAREAKCRRLENFESRGVVRHLGFKMVTIWQRRKTYSTCSFSVDIHMRTVQYKRYGCVRRWSLRSPYEFFRNIRNIQFCFHFMPKESHSIFFTNGLARTNNTLISNLKLMS